MARLFFVRDGRGDYRTSSPYDVDLGVARVVAQRFGVRYFKDGPTINSGTASAFSPYRHVVIEISDSEVGEAFDRSGHYYIVALSPGEAQQLFDIDALRD